MLGLWKSQEYIAVAGIPGSGLGMYPREPFLVGKARDEPSFQERGPSSKRKPERLSERRREEECWSDVAETYAHTERRGLTGR